MLQIPLRRIFLRTDFIEKIDITAFENKVSSVPAFLKNLLKVTSTQNEMKLINDVQKMADYNQKVFKEYSKSYH